MRTTFDRLLPGVTTLALLLGLATAAFDALAWRLAHLPTTSVDAQSAWATAALLVSCVALGMIGSALLTTWGRRPAQRERG